MSMEMNKALDLLHGLVSEVERKTCCHEETHRGGAIWEICDSCGAKWADDEGGKPEFAWPESVEKAREFLATHPAVEQAGGDERTAFEAWMTWLMDHVYGRLPDFTLDDGSGAHYVNADVSYAWTAWQARAALAQPSPVSEALIYACKNLAQITSSDGSGHADIAMAVLRMAGVGDDERERLVNEWKAARAWKPSPAQAEQAEAERPELWAVHAQGPDELYAAFTREDAEKHAAELNALPMPEGIAVGAVVVPSPWPEAEHWKYLAEQERDHKNEIAVRLRQFERICEGLPQDAIDGGWTVQGIRGYAKRLEDQLKAAQAQHSVPEGFRELLEMLVVSDLRKLRYAGAWRREVHDRASSILALLAAAPGKEVPQAWLDVQAERSRQVEAEGWTPEHDDEHDSGELAAAGAAYALHAADHLNPYSQGDGGDEAPRCWPWYDGIAGRGEGPEKTEPAWWKPTTPRRDLVKACALALAEIERLDRAAERGKEGV